MIYQQRVMRVGKIRLPDFRKADCSPEDSQQKIAFPNLQPPLKRLLLSM